MNASIADTPAGQTLATLPDDLPVRAVLRAPETALDTPVPAPSAFADQAAYRAALIARRGEELAAGRARLQQEASALGLAIHMAGALNAVAVEGPAGTLRALLAKVPVDGLALERSIPPSGPRF